MKEIKLNLGSGNIKFPGFINIDGEDGEDITNLDYDDNSVDLIYASHVLEYFDQVEVVDVIGEWYRVLKKGGKIRLAVPDFYELTRLYTQEKKEIKCHSPFGKEIIIDIIKDIKIRDIIGPLFGRMEMGGEMIYHKTTYDFETLAQLLYQIGFKRIKKYDCESVKPHNKIDDQSHAYIPHMDKTGTLISLNVEAIK